MTACPACGQENPEGARFCNGCGGSLAMHSGPREERRIVTILFADMAGFTARAERLDPEDVRSILDRYYARLRAVIESFGGTVEKFIGDAVVAVFGAPAAHGDDPERAVRAALAVCDAVAQMNAADPDLDLEVRLAVNTGEAVVSVALADLHEGMVAGDVVNTASRMQTAAPPNAILIGEETFRATRGVVDCHEVEPLVVKGKQQPVRAWRVAAASHSPGERAGSGVPMLGRAGELAALKRVFEGVVTDRRPHLVTLFGDAGIGKTRLATEFTEGLDRIAVRVLRGRSLPYGAVTPYSPFVQQVKLFCGIFASDDAAAGHVKLASALAEMAGDGAGEMTAHLELLTGLSTQGEVGDRQTLFRAARRFVEALAAERPTVLVFEDVHWADQGTLDLIEVLATRVREVPLMLVALARPDLLLERPAWGGGLPAYTSLSLPPLTPDHAAELAAQLLARGGAGHHELGVARTAEGNPLFIEELAAAAIERPQAVSHHLPTTIRELVLARLDALPAPERRLLLDAAVVGKVFWRGAVERMVQDGDAIGDLLDSLEARDLVRHEPRSWIEHEEQFVFKHAVIRDVAYATLPRAARRDRHVTVAQFLESATAGAAATATALASHWCEAGEPARAVDYLLIAAEQAGRGWAKDEAARLYGQALSLCPEDRDRRREILRKHAMALAALQHVVDARNRSRDSGI